jgi:hypothetical protein
MHAFLNLAGPFKQTEVGGGKKPHSPITSKKYLLQRPKEHTIKVLWPKLIPYHSKLECLSLPAKTFTY